MDNEHVEFNSIREGFSEYEVENGQILKVMLVITDIVLTEKDGQKIPVLGIKDLSTVITDIKLDTTGLEVARREDVEEKDEVKELQVKPIKEIINIYETRSYLFLVPTIIGKVFLTNKKDNHGDPILRFSYLIKVSTIEKRKIYSESKPEAS